MTKKELFNRIKSELEKIGPIPKGKTVKISELSRWAQSEINKLPQSVIFAEVEGVMAHLEQFNR